MFQKRRRTFFTAAPNKNNLGAPIFETINVAAPHELESLYNAASAFPLGNAPIISAEIEPWATFVAIASDVFGDGADQSLRNLCDLGQSNGERNAVNLAVALAHYPVFIFNIISMSAFFCLSFMHTSTSCFRHTCHRLNLYSSILSLSPSQAL